MALSFTRSRFSIDILSKKKKKKRGKNDFLSLSLF